MWGISRCATGPGLGKPHGRGPPWMTGNKMKQSWNMKSHHLLTFLFAKCFHPMSVTFSFWVYGDLSGVFWMNRASLLPGGAWSWHWPLGIWLSIGRWDSRRLRFDWTSTAKSHDMFTEFMTFHRYKETPDAADLCLCWRYGSCKLRGNNLGIRLLDILRF